MNITQISLQDFANIYETIEPSFNNPGFGHHLTSNQTFYRGANSSGAVITIWQPPGDDHAFMIEA